MDSGLPEDGHSCACVDALAMGGDRSAHLLWAHAGAGGLGGSCSVAMGWARRAPLGLLGPMARGHCVTLPPPPQVCPSWGYGSYRPVPLGPQFCYFHSCSGWTSCRGTNMRPAIATTVPQMAALTSRLFVHRGLAVFAVPPFRQASHVSGCCVHLCFRLFLHRIRYLLSARGPC